MIASALAICAEKAPNLAGLMVMVDGEPFRVGLALADITTTSLGNKESFILCCGDPVFLLDRPSMGTHGCASSTPGCSVRAIRQSNEGLASGAPATAFRPIFLRNPGKMKFRRNGSFTPDGPLLAQLN